MSNIEGSKKLRSRNLSQKLPQSQDPVSTIQKTGLTNYSSFLGWSGPFGAVNSHFFCVFGHFWHPDTRTTNQLGDPSASLLSSSEKAVSCNSRLDVRERIGEILEIENCISLCSELLVNLNI